MSGQPTNRIGTFMFSMHYRNGVKNVGVDQLIKRVPTLLQAGSRYRNVAYRLGIRCLFLLVTTSNCPSYLLLTMWQAFLNEFPCPRPATSDRWQFGQWFLSTNIDQDIVERAWSIRPSDLFPAEAKGHHGTMKLRQAAWQQYATPSVLREEKTTMKYPAFSLACKKHPEVVRQAASIASLSIRLGGDFLETTFTFSMENIQGLLTLLLWYEENAAVVAAVPNISRHIQGLVPKTRKRCSRLTNSIFCCTYKGPFRSARFFAWQGHLLYPSYIPLTKLAKTKLSYVLRSCLLFARKVILEKVSIVLHMIWPPAVV